MNNFWQDIIIGYLAGLRHFVADKGLVLMLFVAPIIYGFYYPWSMSLEVINLAPVAIIDYDKSHLSRQLISYANANNNIDVIMVGQNEEQMQQALYAGDIVAYAIIPNELSRNVAYGKKVSIKVFTNAAYPMLNKSVSLGFYDSFNAVSRQISIDRNLANGMHIKQAEVIYEPIRLSNVAMFNPIEGYSSQLTPIVYVLIMHQLVIMSIAIAVGTWSKNKQLPPNLPSWIGVFIFFCHLSLYAGLILLGFMLDYHNFPRGGNVFASFVLLLFFVPTLVMFGIALGLFLRNREHPIYFLVFTSIPIFFMTGFPWPEYLLPKFILIIRWLIPVTPAINANYKLSQLGSSLYDVQFELAVLIILFVFATLISYYLFNKYHQPNSKQD